MSEEQKAKIALAHRGMKATKEAKLKMSNAKVGKPSWNKGKPSPWAGANGFKKGIPSWNTGKQMSETMKEKMLGNKNGSGNKGRIFKEETLGKMRLSKVNFFTKINPNYKMKNRNKRIIENGGFHNSKEWLELKKKYNYTCPACGKSEPEIKLTKDHIIPLLKEGKNNIENIQPLCMPCNRNKHTQTIKY